MNYYPDVPKWMEYSLIGLMTAVIAVGVVIVMSEAASCQWRPAWKAARIMPEVPREYARWEPVRASDLGPPFSRWRPIRWLPTPK